jgi:hypothetical protein
MNRPEQNNNQSKGKGTEHIETREARVIDEIDREGKGYTQASHI